MAVLLLVMGLAIAGIWTRDILAGDQVDLSDGVFRARDPDGGTLFWPHWLAEYGTAGALIIGGLGLLIETRWAGTVAAIATGALLYTSMNALGWALAKPGRYPYALPMVVGLVFGVISAVYLLTG